MVDSQRLRSVPEGIQLVSEVAAILSRSHGGTTHVLEIVSYFPVDVDSAGRILEGLEEFQGVKRVQKDSICYYELENPDLFSLREIDIEKEEHLDDAAGFMRALSTLKKDEDWVKKVREQHELLQIAAGAKSRTIELSHFTSRSDIASAKIQSILNDFAAEGYISISYDENNDTLNYTFPQFAYPKRRMQHNLSLLERVETKNPVRPTLWLYVVVAAIILLGIIIFSRL
ncbi:MAG: hypothetical protein H0U74_09690 [Bradymonadaceae bacterium]|nr:hypothetical protein [Lujinxingiaceae bacterium]